MAIDHKTLGWVQIIGGLAALGSMLCGAGKIAIIILGLIFLVLGYDHLTTKKKH